MQERDSAAVTEDAVPMEAGLDELLISRRELLRKAGWIVPTLVVLPLGSASAQTGGFGSLVAEELSPDAFSDRLYHPVTEVSGEVDGSGSTKGQEGGSSNGLGRGGGNRSYNGNGKGRGNFPK